MSEILQGFVILYLLLSLDPKFHYYGTKKEIGKAGIGKKGNKENYPKKKTCKESRNKG